jgi:hypothetical protein
MVSSLYPSTGNYNVKSVCLQHSVTRATLAVKDIENLSPEREYTVSIAAGTGVTSLVAAVTGHALVVDSYLITAQSGTSVRLMSGTGYITGTHYIASNGNVLAEDCVIYCNSGEALKIENATGNIGGHVTYRIV